MEKVKEFMNKYWRFLLLILLGIVTSMIALIIFLFKQDYTKENVAEIEFLEEMVTDQEDEEIKNENDLIVTNDNNKIASESQQEIMVDIKGAVNAPGVYQMELNQRIIDAIEQAGGFLEDADESVINLAQIIMDEMVIYVPKEGEEVNDLTSTQIENVSQMETDTDKEKIDLNTADKNLLTTLNGIGDVKADSIISYREEHGLFQSIEEIKEVSGIGDATYEKLKENLYVAP